MMVKKKESYVAIQGQQIIGWMCGKIYASHLEIGSVKN